LILSAGEVMTNVKTAISIPKTLFEETNKLAEELKLSRSRVVTMAIQEYLKRHKNRALLEQLNRVHADGLDKDDHELVERMFISHKRFLEDEGW
jgi:metal-responsive CopG/Arc/MetJ family transcriptional regulator